MNKKMILLKGFTILCFCVFSTTPVWAQDFCEGNFDYDQDVDGADAALFKSDFGRSPFKNPCPPGGSALVPKTGQEHCYSWENEQVSCTSTSTGEGGPKGQDGELQKGVELPDSRFTDNGNGTVTDNLTGLMWLQDATCIKTHYLTFDNDGSSGDDGMVTWFHALDFVAGINAGTYSLCGAGHSDWRLPQVRELFALIDFDTVRYFHLLLVFVNVYEGIQEGSYWWTSTTEAESPALAWAVNIGGGILGYPQPKTSSRHVWPVRGGR